MAKFYCMKCRHEVEVDDASTKTVRTRNKRYMMKAECPQCGTKVNKFVKKGQ